MAPEAPRPWLSDSHVPISEPITVAGMLLTGLEDVAPSPPLGSFPSASVRTHGCPEEKCEPGCSVQGREALGF